MNTVPIEAEIAYSSEILEAAAGCFIKHYFRSKGRWLLVACVLNAIGFALALALGARASLSVALVACVVLFGPAYCAYLFTAFPARYASRAMRLLPPTAHVLFTASTFEISTRGGRVSRILWTSIKEVWECPGGFVLVLSQFAVVFVVVPKSQLPYAAYEYLVGKVREHAV